MKLLSRIELVSYASEWWRLWSIRLGAAGVMLTGWLIGAPDAILMLWAGLPEPIRAMIPPQYMPFVSLTLVIAGMLAQMVRQKKVIAIVAEKKAENGTT